MQIPRWSPDVGVAWLVLSTLLSLLGLARPVHAAEFSCAAGDVACLIEAIHVANANGEANTITLEAGTYTLTAVDNDTDGPNGLPSVTGRLTLTGAGADTTVLERAAGALPFRLLHVDATGTLTLDGLTLQGGDLAGLADGGGVLNRGTLTVTDSLLRGHAARIGGGMHSSSATLTLTHSTLSGNTATGASCPPVPQCGPPAGWGGGIYSNGPLTISHSTLNGNTASGSLPGVGGGIYSNASLTITNSTLSGNVAAGSGGGIFSNSPLTINNSTVSGNTAGGGGGITQIDTLLTLTNSTVSGNTASFNSGGIFITRALSFSVPGQAILRNTILARNTMLPGGRGPDCAYAGSPSGSITSQGHNLLGDPTGCSISLVPSDLTGDPGLGPFTDDGTPGQGYLPLLPTSPAIDAGDPAACPPTDQLGQLRLPPCDIGAVEFTPVTVTLGLNQAMLRAGDTLRVRLGLHNPGPSVTADAYLGVLLPDGVTVLFVTRLAPLDGVVTRLDADPRTFAPLAPAYAFPAGEDVAVEDFFVYTLTGEEAPGAYALFTLLTPPGAFVDGQVDAGDLLGLTLQPFTLSP
jgi:hypothetical protein